MTEPIEPVVTGPSSIHGTGVFAARDIATGEHLGTYTGSPTDQDGIHVLWVEDDDGEFRAIDGDGVLRWLNHSRRPNVEFDGPELYALTDISAGDELTIDYGDEWAHVD